MVRIEQGDGPSAGGTAEKKKDATPAKLELDATRDTVTRGDKVSGLGRVFVHRAADALADDIANAVSKALPPSREAPWKIRVVADLASLRGDETLALLNERLEAREERLNAVLGVPPSPTNAQTSAEQEGTGTRQAIAPAAAAALQGVGVLTKLFARDYQISGSAVAVDDLGIDLYVAEKLLSKHGNRVAISVDRVTPQKIAEAVVFQRVAAVERRVRTELAQRVVDAAVTAVSAKATVAALETTVSSTQALLTELYKNRQHAGDEIAALQSAFTSAMSKLGEERPVAAREEAEASALASLAADLAAFLEDVTTVPPGAAETPLAVAAHAENAGTDYVLYVRLLAGGMDEVVTTSIVRRDRWTLLAGATVEYALVKDGEMLASGSRSAVEATRLNLGALFKMAKVTKPLPRTS